MPFIDPRLLDEIHISWDRALAIKLGITLILLITLWLLRKILVHLLLEKNLPPAKIYRKKRIISNIYHLLQVFILLLFWIEKVHIFLTFLGLVSAALVIALKEPLSSLAGRVFIVWRKPFIVGDRIEFDGIKGDVIDTSLFRFIMVEVGNWVEGDQSTGRIVHIPNRLVFDKPVFNYSQGFHFIWDEIHIHLRLDSDRVKATAILQELIRSHHENVVEVAQAELKEASQHYLLIYRNLEPTIYQKIKDGKLILSLRFLCDPKRRRVLESELWDAIITRFSQEESIQIIA